MAPKPINQPEESHSAMRWRVRILAKLTSAVRGWINVSRRNTIQSLPFDGIVATKRIQISLLPRFPQMASSLWSANLCLSCSCLRLRLGAWRSLEIASVLHIAEGRWTRLYIRRGSSVSFRALPFVGPAQIIVDSDDVYRQGLLDNWYDSTDKDMLTQYSTAYHCSLALMATLTGFVFAREAESLEAVHHFGKAVGLINKNSTLWKPCQTLAFQL